MVEFCSDFTKVKKNPATSGSVDANFHELNNNKHECKLNDVMSLVKCNECSKDVSDKAVACPACGNPLVVKAPQSIVAPTIELTNKKWKKMTILGLVLFFIGFMLVFKSPGLGVFFMFAAFVIAIVTRIGAWWTNG